MQSNAAEKLKSPTSTKKTSNKDLIQIISGRQSKELFIGFCGAIGAGIKTLQEVAQQELEELGYEVVQIRVSQLMKQFPEAKGISPKNTYERYTLYQDLGDKLREKYKHHILASAAVNEISILKQQAISKLTEDPSVTEEEATLSVETRKVAYFINQLKNPAEVELLRLAFQNNFYLIGVIRSEEERKRNLRDEGIKPKEVDELIHKDRKSEDKYGQQSEKTILDSDIYIKNNQSHVTQLKNSVKRFFDLIHGVNGITPTQHEKGMFSAFSASLQSACLSRQVGAAIYDKDSNLISTGKNDVPKPFGGLYSSDDNENDHRCIRKGGKCYNDTYKLKIKEKIYEKLQLTNLKEVEIISLTESIYKDTGISSILEFSRSIHAEMDAITSISRNGNGATQGTILYTTTYPCHNCARHIVAAGIERAIYIEPYEKSLALDLHDDAITNHLDQSKVQFEPFEGISPRRYAKFFFPSAERKDSLGKAVKITTKYKNHVDIQYLDNSKTYQEVISKEFSDTISE